MKQKLRHLLGTLAAAALLLPASLQAQPLSQDPFIRKETHRSQFEPGGAKHLFGDRGNVTERSGRIRIIDGYTHQIGSLKLQSAHIEGNIGYTNSFSGHPWHQHSPFDQHGSSSASARTGSVASGYQTLLNLRWTGHEHHPADGYDGDQGGGFPAPQGARDLYRYSVSGEARSIEVTLPKDSRSPWQRITDRWGEARDGFFQDAQANNDKIFRRDPKLDTWGNTGRTAEGLTGAAASGFKAIGRLLGTGDIADGLGQFGAAGQLAGIAALPHDQAFKSIDALAGVSEYGGDLSRNARELADKYPNTAPWVSAATEAAGMVGGAKAMVTPTRTVRQVADTDYTPPSVDSDFGQAFPNRTVHPDNNIGRNNSRYDENLQKKISANNGMPKQSPDVSGTSRGSRVPEKNYTHTTYNNGSAITDGNYITDPIGMARHKPRTSITAENINVPDTKSRFRSDIDADRATLDAARYADEHNLWNNKGKAKVLANDIVGYTDGQATRIINVYRQKKNRDGLRPIHASPGKEH